MMKQKALVESMMTDFDYEFYYTQGEHAYYRDTECPYEAGSKEEEAWQEGYYSAKMCDEFYESNDMDFCSQDEEDE